MTTDNNGAHSLGGVETAASAADEALSKARRIIADAKSSGATKLELKDLKALTLLPPEIADLSALRELELFDIEVADLSPLSSLVNLAKLDLVCLPLEDLSPLARLTGLKHLLLSQIPATDYSAIAELSSLETLRLQHGVPISDLAPLAKLRALHWLSLEYCITVSDLSPVAGLTNLRRLDLGITRVLDLSPLAGLTELQSLDLNHTKVTDLAPLSKLTGMIGLNLANTEVSDIAPLSRMTALCWLDLNSTHVSDLRPLARLTSLRWLDVESTKVADLDPLAELTSLINPKPFTDEEEDDDYSHYDYEEDYDPDGYGLRYNATPATDLQPYNVFVQLRIRERTLHTINHIRAQKRLQPFYPEGYETPKEPLVDSKGTLSAEALARFRGELQMAQKRVGKLGEIIEANASKDTAVARNIFKGMLTYIGGAILAGVVYVVCLVIKMQAAAVHAFIDAELGGNQTLHRIIDLIVNKVPG